MHNALWIAFMARKVITVQTYSARNGLLGPMTPEAHAFAVVGFNNLTGQVTLRNPWNAGGPYGSQFTMGIAEFFATFDLITIQK